MNVVRSGGRAFEILEYFRVERRPLSLKAVVDHFGYPLVSTADILKSRLHLGYLSFDVKSKTYLPTPRLFELSSWISQDLLDPRMVVAMPLAVTYSGRRLALGCSGPADEIEPRVDEIAAQMRNLVADHFREFAPTAVLAG
jgi:DNA-binding IclR family transcriptional regulator